MTNYLKVTKKPVYEDAVQFIHDLPKSWNLCKTFVGAKWSQTRNAGFVNTAYVETPEGRTALVDGDFIVHGLNQGEFFVLSEVQFHESYDIISSMRKWEPDIRPIRKNESLIDWIGDKDPWEDLTWPDKDWNKGATHPDQLYPNILKEFQDLKYEEIRKIGLDFGERSRTVTFNDEEVGRMEGKYHDDRVDAFASAIDISKKLVSPMDHILSDLRSQAAVLHGEKVSKNDKTETDG